MIITIKPTSDDGYYVVIDYGENKQDFAISGEQDEAKALMEAFSTIAFEISPTSKYDKHRPLCTTVPGSDCEDLDINEYNEFIQPYVKELIKGES